MDLRGVFIGVREGEDGRQQRERRGERGERDTDKG